MRAKPVPREQANRDVDQAIAHYLTEATERVALGFVDVLEQAYAHTGWHPSAGSPRYAGELNLAALRSWPLKNYQYLVFHATFPRGCKSPTRSDVLDLHQPTALRGEWPG